MKHTLKTHEALRRAAAEWLLCNDIHNICSQGNELGERFLREYRLPELEEELSETLVDEEENITLIFQSRLYLPAASSVNRKAQSFIILRYVRALYDDLGNIYKYITLGYSF